MSAFSLFGGRFDRDPADCFWTERDEPEERSGVRPDAGRHSGERLQASSMCFFHWDIMIELAAMVEPPEVE